MNTNSYYLLGLIICIAGCGSIAPEIDENYCSEQDLGVTTAALSTAGSGGANSATATSTNTSLSATSAASTGSGIEVTIYDTPMADEVASRLHSCHKLTYSQLGNFLRHRGAAIPQGNISDVKTTQTNIFGMNQTLGNIFGGSNMACEMADTVANGSGQNNDPLCPSNEVCFCNQDDKQNEINKSCLDVGNNSPDAKDGFCVSKPSTAGFLYFSGKDALGVPKLDSRLSEKEEHSTASAMKIMDIFIQAAPQIIANIADPIKAPACTLNGKNMPMFNQKDGSCIEESISCLIGYPATDDHLLLCNLLLQKADPSNKSDIIKKQNIAVAALLSAAHSCQ